MLAFYGADTQDASILFEAYNQCKLYRDILQPSGTGAWSHIMGPQSHDPGLWSTGNGTNPLSFLDIKSDMLKGRRST